MFTDLEHLTSSPALQWGFWDKQHAGALHTLETQHMLSPITCGMNVRGMETLSTHLEEGKEQLLSS